MNFVSLELLIDQENIIAYDCNLLIYREDELFLFIDSMLNLFPRSFKKCGYFNHFPENLLNNEWTYERKNDSPRNDSEAACCSYSLSYIEHRITLTAMTFINDNTISRMQWRWVIGMIDKELTPSCRLQVWVEMGCCNCFDNLNIFIVIFSLNLDVYDMVLIILRCNIYIYIDIH